VIVGPKAQIELEQVEIVHLAHLEELEEGGVENIAGVEEVGQVVKEAGNEAGQLRKERGEGGKIALARLWDPHVVVNGEGGDGVGRLKKDEEILALVEVRGIDTRLGGSRPQELVYCGIHERNPYLAESTLHCPTTIPANTAVYNTGDPLTVCV